VKRRAALLATSLAVLGVLAAPGVQAAPKNVRVSVANFEFTPKTAKVRKGGKVTWAFEQGRHNVVGKGWKSAVMSKGTYSRKFKRAGKYKYSCTLHPGMDGVVRVRK
jgi:plastocyanin